MRLIDADVIQYYVLEKDLGYGWIASQGVWKKDIDAMPTIEPERKKGKWVDDGGLYKCSNCNHLFSELWWVGNCPIDRMKKIMRFCPNCGAKMEVEHEQQM